MGQIGWNESSPPDSESAGLGDDRIRSLLTSLRIGLDDEHNWPSAGGDAGKHRLGSARVYFGPQSTVSSAGTDGKLMMTSDTSRLFHVGSGGTNYIGGPDVISAGSFPGGAPPQRFRWIEEFGTSVTGSIATASNGSVLVTIPNSGYSGIPYIFCQSVEASIASVSDLKLVVSTVNAASFVVTAIAAGSALAPGRPFHWRSLGTRTL